MNRQNQPARTVVISEGPSTLGLVGLVFSTLGWLTCGLLCIPGAFLSFLGLFSSKPKGYALAGLIVGFPGVLFFLFIGMGLLAGFAGLSEAQRIAAEQQRQQGTPGPVADYATDYANSPEPTPAYGADNPESEPSPELELASPEPLPPPEPPPPAPAVRTFTDASGKFTVDAEVIAVKQGFVKLRDAATSKELVVEISKLSTADQTWLAENITEQP